MGRHWRKGFLGDITNTCQVRRTAGFKGHKFSVREIAQFATNRGYTSLVILMQAEHTKQPDGLDIIHLPAGPHFHFSVTNWVDGKLLPRHATDTGHYPELILNGFKTPLGILTAHLWRGMFPLSPELVSSTRLYLVLKAKKLFKLTYAL